MPEFAGEENVIRNAMRKLDAKYREPLLMQVLGGFSCEEIARELKLDEEEVRETIKIGNSHMSLDAPLVHGEDSKLMDLLRDDDQELPDDGVIEISLQDEINQTLDTLTEREKEVIKLYFGIGEETAHTLEEIGQRFNLTRERARQIKEKALRRLKHSSRSQRLRIYRT